NQLVKQHEYVGHDTDCSQVLKGKMKENVEQFAEQGLISKKLASILLDAPVELDEEALQIKAPSREALEPLLAELEFRTIGRRVFGEEFNVTEMKTTVCMKTDLYGTPAVTAKSETSTSVEMHPCGE